MKNSSRRTLHGELIMESSSWRTLQGELFMENSSRRTFSWRTLHVELFMDNFSRRRTLHRELFNENSSWRTLHGEVFKALYKIQPLTPFKSSLLRIFLKQMNNNFDSWTLPLVDLQLTDKKTSDVPLQICPNTTFVFWNLQHNTFFTVLRAYSI